MIEPRVTDDRTPSPVTNWLSNAHPVAFSAFAIVAAFSTYFCMYAFRKPFAVGAFEGTWDVGFLPPIDFKIILIVSQVIGYCLSKFMGIKVISEMTRAGRAAAIVGVIGFAWASLLLFAIAPVAWKPLCMFLNGIPLGMVWGLVFGFLEGRKVSEVLGAGLSASYIVASGFVKSVGQFTMDTLGVPEFWMPFVTGALFFPIMLVAVWGLAQLPPPSAEDEAARTKREPMDGKARAAFVLSYAPGLFCLTSLYILLTAYRDFRDNFAREIWDALGTESAAILTWSEIPVTVIVLGSLALLMVIKNNRTALLVVHGLMLSGTALVGVATFAWQAGVLDPTLWMVAVGTGLYVAYVPYGCVLFDRLIAALGVVGTAGFMIYVTDAFGYLGSVALLLYKNFGQADLSWLEFFTKFSYITSIACTLLYLGSLAYFALLTRGEGGAAPLPAPAK
ncbi:MAG: hypothetical protein H6739_15975 [Alphaproteobacteria bacterium]|nr:hypothetical protein [Alphaproteobacteria bacterium]